jgi:predicted HD phosphohydrolase
MDVATLTTVDDLMGLLARCRSSEGEGLDQLAHGLQCAHELAVEFPDDVELQVAGLVHDIGHRLLPNDDRVDHDLMHGIAAGHAVRDLLGERVAALVELHVPAKRYLVSVESEYGDVLSPMSAITLANQGGPMTPEEIDEFEELPELDAAVALRRADEAAKVPGRIVPDLDHWRPIIESLAR